MRAQRAPLHASFFSAFSTHHATPHALRHLLALASLCTLLFSACTSAPTPSATPSAASRSTDITPTAPTDTPLAEPTSPTSPSPTAPRPHRPRTLPTLPLQLDIELPAQRRADLTEDYPGTLRETPRPDGTTRVVERVDLEDYLVGVLRGELVVWDAPAALLDAQAIAARSYALAALELRAQQGRSGPLPAGTAAQAYRGAPRGKLSAAAREVEQRVHAAIERTRGRVLVADGCVLDARFHAACGGRTAAFADVFAEQEDLGAMPSVACAACAKEPAWKTTLPHAELARVWNELGLSPKERALVPLRRDADGRWLEVELRSKGKQRRMSFEEWRARIGASRVPSSRISNSVPANGLDVSGALALRGRGRGHGVGLCQLGARALAQRGTSADAILAHYFPGARVERLASRAKQ